MLLHLKAAVLCSAPRCLSQGLKLDWLGCKKAIPRSGGEADF